MRHVHAVVHFVAPVGTAAEFLGWDDAFLEQVSIGGPEVLWFWEAVQPFIVVGRGQRVDLEVNRIICELDGIPILRRTSGGGAVVQGTGCLNYGLVLRIPDSGPLLTVTTTNLWIMERQAAALRRAGLEGVVVRGHTDLAILQNGMERKFSGNAQRRLRDCVLFHGTVLYCAAWENMDRWLKHPSSEPLYRSGRSHSEFLTNIPFSAPQIRDALITQWQAETALTGAPWDARSAWIDKRYSLSEWNLAR